MGLRCDGHELNAYSSTPELIDKWIEAALHARVLCGADGRLPPLEEEVTALDSLKRGVFAKKNLKEGSSIDGADVYFAMPCQEGQLTSGEYGQNFFDEGSATIAGVKKDGPLMQDQLEIPADPEKQVLLTAIHEMKSMLNETRIALPASWASAVTSRNQTAAERVLEFIRGCLPGRFLCDTVPLDRLRNARRARRRTRRIPPVS